MIASHCFMTWPKRKDRAASMKRARAGNRQSKPAVWINVWVPHLCQEAEGGWRVGIVDGELDPSLGDEKQWLYAFIHLVNLYLFVIAL